VITDLSPLYHNKSLLLKAEDIQLKKGSWVRFSDKFPNDQKTGWASGKLFTVSSDTILVDYPVSNNIVSQDYVNMDLTNQTNPVIPGVLHPTAAQKGTYQMYPVQEYVLYQIAIGMKKGNYFVQLYVPLGQTPIYQLGSSAVTPSITDPLYKYLGAKYPNDSPVDSPTWFLYTILNAPQIVLQEFMDGGDTMVGTANYGKATIVFRINKCQLSLLTLPALATVATQYGPQSNQQIPSGYVGYVTGGPGGDTKVTINGAAGTVGAKQTYVALAGSTVSTGSGSLVITTLNDVQRWDKAHESALYIPYYTELTGF
jgi:hypothetical protein